MAFGTYSIQKRWFGIAMVLFVLFSIAMPKGGISAGGIPITNGYVITSLLAAIGFLMAVGTGAISHRSLMVLALMLPFQIWVVYTFYFFGLHPAWIGNAVAQMIIFVAFPIMFFIGLAFFIKYGDMHLTSKWLVWSLRFVTVYGLVLFIYYYFTKDVFEVPFLIVNLGDAGELYNKNNARGEFAKLFATYNNGNIFGVCMCMLAPIYMSLDKNKIWKTLFLTAIFLSLSRTAWVGLILILLYEFVAMRLSWQKTLAGAIGLVGLFAAPALLNLWFGFGDNFLFDANLGGRLTNIQDETQFTFLPKAPIGDVKEIVYLTMVLTYGVAGFLLFLIFMGAPIVVASLSGALATKNGRRLVFGMVLYLVLCAGDGAFVFPPTMTLYYFIAVAAVERGFDGLAAVRDAKAVFYAEKAFVDSRRQANRGRAGGAISAALMGAGRRPAPR